MNVDFALARPGTVLSWGTAGIVLHWCLESGLEWAFSIWRKCSGRSFDRGKTYINDLGQHDRCNISDSTEANYAPME
jgi:hypothetical protein